MKNEGVAAPLEPLEIAAQKIAGHMGCCVDDIDLVREILNDLAAAVSKNLQQKLADADQAACTWIKDAELWRKLHKAATDELAKCGKENCMGHDTEGCRRWVSEERLNLEKEKVAELEKEITALRETK